MNGMINVDSGAAIRLAIESAGISRADVARLIGVSPPRMTVICRSPKCTTDTIARIASALGMRPSELLALGENNQQ